MFSFSKFSIPIPKYGTRRRKNYYNSNVKNIYLGNDTCPVKPILSFGKNDMCTSKSLSKLYNNKNPNENNIKLICRILVLYAQCYCILSCLKDNIISVKYPPFDEDGFRYIKGIITTYMSLPISQYINIYMPNELSTFNNKNTNKTIISVDSYIIPAQEMFNMNSNQPSDSKTYILSKKIYNNCLLISDIRELKKVFDERFNIEPIEFIKKISKKRNSFNDNKLKELSDKIINILLNFFKEKKLNNTLKLPDEAKDIFKLFTINSTIKFLNNRYPVVVSNDTNNDTNNDDYNGRF